jgi:hypothetical protein
MTESLISASDLKMKSIETILSEDLEFLTKLQVDLSSFLLTISQEMQASYLKYLRSNASNKTPQCQWTFDFEINDPRPEYHLFITKTFKDKGYMIKENKPQFYTISESAIAKSINLPECDSVVNFKGLFDYLSQATTRLSQLDHLIADIDVQLTQKK